MGSIMSRYKKGQQVIFIAKPFYSNWAQQDSGKRAIIVNCYDAYYDIFIKDSKNNACMTSNITWQVPENDLRPCNPQLLFEFMCG